MKTRIKSENPDGQPRMTRMARMQTSFSTEHPEPIRTLPHERNVFLIRVIREIRGFSGTRVKFFAAALLLAGTGSALAEVHYVDVNSTNATPPYSSWATAATNIQDAVDAAVAGDEIVVTSGTYATGRRAVSGFPSGNNRVAVDKPLNIRSINGPQSTIIDGGRIFRCVYLTNGASLSGFTLTRGFARIGGGAFGGTLNNCTLIGNTTSFGPIYYEAYGGGAAYCTLNSCTLASNSVVASGRAFGGGAASCTLNNCTLTENSADNHFLPDPSRQAYGGGAYQCTLNNCTLTGNSAHLGGGAYNSGLNNCIVYNNTGDNYYYGTLNYCSTTPLPANGNGNITNAPLFVDRASGNLRLQSNSPCINAGNNSYVTSAIDLDGNPRIVGGTVDMGAYEFQAVRYVDVNSTNATPPYGSWSTAATNIQDAVDVAAAGDEIVVTNGNYDPVEVRKSLILRSVNGPQLTIIDGGGGARCATLINGASLSGFTLTNGYSYTYGGFGGGGVWCEGTNAVVSNCVIVGNQASATYDDYPPFRFARGGGAYGGTLNHCTLTGNSIIVNEFSDFAIIYAYGGGAYASTLNNCTLTANSVEANIGHIASAVAGGGGAAYCALNNCVLSGNRAASSAPLGSVPGPNTYGGGAYDCTLNNCTLTGNRGGGASSSTLNNCINFRNGPGVLEGNNWFGDPLFVDTNGWANLRLQSNSPCINAGGNAFVPAGPDLDGNPRIAGGTVDIGAYEFQSPASKISYAWLQQFNLPINPATDTADPDGDSLNNWQEWRCATEPTNALSALRLLAPVVVGSDLLVRWESVADRTYFLERSTSALSAFTPLATGIPGQPGTTTYTDTNAIGTGPQFYRVGVNSP